MPTPKKGESRKDFAARCIPIVKREAKAKGEDLSNAKAAGKCYGIYDSHKSARAVSLSDHQARVTAMFFETVDGAWSHWPIAVYDDSLVTKKSDGRYFKFAYNWNDGEPTFDEPVEVEQDFRGTPLVRPPRGEPIRAIGDNRYECCMVRFTTEEEKDAYETYFDASTRFYLDWFEKRPWIYEHTMHPRIEPSRAKMGMWDETELTDEGLFVRGELDRSNVYWKDYRVLADAEVLYPSSGTLSYAMRVAEDGHVDDWPFIEGTSTVTPADIGADAVQPVLRAYRSLEDSMSEGRKGFLAGLFSKRNDDEQPNEEAPETPVETAEADEPEAPAADVDDDEVRAAIRAVDTAVAENREGIVQVDGALRAVVERLDAMSETLRSLAETETEKVQDSMRQGGFLDRLWSATRATDAPPSSETPTTAIEPESDFGEFSNSPAARIAAEQRRKS